MSGWKQTISNLQQYIAQLIRKKEQLQQTLQQRDKELATCREEVEALKKQAALLQIQHDLLKASRGELPEAEKKALGKKLQSFISEIDACIALLSR